jgi:hypothetical protein
MKRRFRPDEIFVMLAGKAAGLRQLSGEQRAVALATRERPQRRAELLGEIEVYGDQRAP